MKTMKKRTSHCGLHSSETSRSRTPFTPSACRGRSYRGFMSFYWSTAPGTRTTTRLQPKFFFLHNVFLPNCSQVT